MVRTISEAVTGTALQVTANGTSTGQNSQGSRNFTLVTQTIGTGTARGKIEATMDGSTWYDVIWGTAMSNTSASTVAASTVSNQAHGHVRVRMESYDSPDTNATFSAWLITS